MQRALLVLLEMLRLQVLLIGGIRRINLKDANLRGVFGTLHREQADDARLTLHAQAVHLVGKRQIRFQVLRIHLDFSNAHNHI